MTISATLNLVRKDPVQRLLIPQFTSIDEAMLAAVEAVKLKPSAVELVDDIILNATKANIEQFRNRFFLEGDPKCILIIQFEGNSAEELDLKSQQLVEIFQEKKLGYTHPKFSDVGQMNQVWELRRAG